jgi:outer membrane protein OmpA-like peptidoglycan-associated protein
VFAEIAKRPVPDVLVMGHTDTVGTNQVNDPLSQQRAEVIRAGLIRSGIAPENITAAGRGKRELLVPTADGVVEPRNRRVEIIVR